MFLDGLYGLAAAVTSPWWIFRLLTKREFRAVLPRRLARAPLRPRSGSPRIWAHCSSVGEFNAARPFLTGARERFPGADIIVTTFTVTGQEQARKQFGAENVYFLPLDFSWVIRRFLRRVNPDALVLVELEFWPNLLLQTARAKLPLLVINGRMEERSLRFWRRWRFLLSPALDETRLNMYCIQNSTYATRFRELGARDSRLRVTGTMKYDAVRLEVGRTEREGLLDSWAKPAKGPIIVGGSVWPGEEELLLDSYRRLREEFAGLRLILAPRHLDRADGVAETIRRAGFSCARRSRPGEPAADDAVLLLDTLGELTIAYAVAACAFVGKTLRVGGGHNVLEPAALGTPVLFGPLTRNCAEEAATLLASGAARRVGDGDELTAALRELLADAGLRERMGAAGREAVRQRRGATERNLEALGELLAARRG